MDPVLLLRSWFRGAASVPNGLFPLGWSWDILSSWTLCPLEFLLSFLTSVMLSGQGAQSCPLHLIQCSPFLNLGCDHWGCLGRGHRQQERGGSGELYDFALTLMDI